MMIILICNNINNTFSLHQGGVVISSQITHVQLSDIYLLSLIQGTCILMSVIALFLQFTTASCIGIPSSPGVKLPETGECWPELHRNQAIMAAWHSIIYLCTKARCSFLSFYHCLAAPTVIPLLPMATFTTSIDPSKPLSIPYPLSTYICHQHSSSFIHSLHML